MTQPLPPTGNPDAEYIFNTGKTAKAAAKTLQSNTELTRLSKQIAHLHNHIILCSLHNLGYRILEQLLDAKIPVIVIDDDPDPRFARLAQRRQVTIISEDST
jgi:hypothetical protein